MASGSSNSTTTSGVNEYWVAALLHDVGKRILGFFFWSYFQRVEQIIVAKLLRGETIHRLSALRKLARQGFEDEGDRREALLPVDHQKW